VTPIGVSHYIIFQGCACLNVSHFKLLKYFTIFLHIILEYNLKKRLEFFFSFYKVGNWSIFVETNVMYLCTQKHKYIPKIIWMILNLYESWRYIDPCHFTKYEPCLDTMWLIWNFSFQKMCGKLKIWQEITST